MARGECNDFLVWLGICGTSWSDGQALDDASFRWFDEDFPGAEEFNRFLHVGFGPERSTAMMPIELFTLAWRMSKTTFGKARLICQMMGCSTSVEVGKVNQHALGGFGHSGRACKRRAKWRRSPPAIAGTMLISSPGLTGFRGS
jgi:hypothetical protein